MEQKQQKTLKYEISCVGIGLHSGQKVSMRFKPADVNTGIVFHRTDEAGNGAVIPAHHDYVVDTRLCTCVGNKEGVRVSTIEHLMAAIHAKGLNNLIIEIDGAEVPIMDGSAAPFIFLFECAGIKVQRAPLKAIRVLKKVSVIDGDKEVSLEPCPDGLKMRFEIDFKDSVIGHEEQFLEFNLTNFKTMFSRARTFGFLKEIEMLRAAGLARGGSLDNAVLVDGDKIVNKDGLRYKDEFVRHKMLDAVGDLYMAGLPLFALFTGKRSGHTQTNALLSALFADKDAYEIVDMSSILPEDEAEESDFQVSA